MTTEIRRVHKVAILGVSNSKALSSYPIVSNQAFRPQELWVMRLYPLCKTLDLRLLLLDD